MKRVSVVLLMYVLISGGSECALSSTGADPVMLQNGNTGARYAPRNAGTQVWMVPVPAGDMQKLAQHPELWPNASRRLDVFSFYFLAAYHHPGFECGTPCGPNTYPNLVTAVPEGMFKWVADRYLVGMEAGSVKSFSCTEQKIREEIGRYTNVAIDNMEKVGGRLDFITLAEPLLSGLAVPGAPFTGGCGLNIAEVARLQRVFNDTVHAQHPEVQIGLVEPYPFFGPDVLMSFVLELEHAGVRLPYLHLDMDLRGVVQDHVDVRRDVQRLRDFCAARGIAFGMVVFGNDGSSNEEFSTDAWATARMIVSTGGVNDHTILQSWADHGDPNGLKDRPDTVPETNGATHTGLLLSILEYMHIRPLQ